MNEHKPKECLPSLEEVRKWRQMMHDCLPACVQYSLTAEGLSHFLRLAEAQRRYEKLGLLAPEGPAGHL